MPVEEERGDFDERVDNEGNQPILKPAESKPESDWPTMAQIEEHTPNEKLPLAQPEEQEMSRGKAASGDGEGEDEANEAAQERRIVKFPDEGTTQSQSHRRGDAKPNPADFDGTEPVSRPMDHDKTLSKGQHPPEVVHRTFDRD